jgi:O-6-methylguanine DNA methyltransferase
VRCSSYGVGKRLSLRALCSHVKGQFGSTPRDHASAVQNIFLLLRFAFPTVRYSTMSQHPKVTEYQERVYSLLQQIPEGRITTYAALAKALSSSPRAVGGALRNNPFAPEIPCHRCIASTGVSVFATCLIALVPARGLTKTVYWRIQGRLGQGAQRSEPGVKTEAVGRRGRVI